MSRHVFRLNHFNPRPTLSWGSAPEAKNSLIALSQWLLHKQRAQVIEVQAMHTLGDSATESQAHATQASETLIGLGACSTSSQANARPASTRPHLKVVMVRDAHTSQTLAPTRLVISGRMADVCAELDRLAA